ncbi:MAG: sulfite exporter TauE/SafE family protein [Calditrichaeota bacterium]|nr:sulfite exporter TauE/SafE family protein [Calditrichota bacterium]
MDLYPFLITVALVFVAYFVKGFTGFGPALILIPTLSILYNPPGAIFLATFFDLIAGFLLLRSVYRQVDWKLVLPVLALFFPGAYLGARLMTLLPVMILKKILAFALIFFIILILINSFRQHKFLKIGKSLLLQTVLSFFAGFGGGLVGISGPLLVIYFKLSFPKSYFRAQLIAIFAFGAAWRLFLYHSLGAGPQLSTPKLLLLITVTLLAIWTGAHFHLKVNEQKFDRIVAFILLIPSVFLFLG